MICSLLLVYSPNLQRGGHIGFGADPLGVSIGVGIGVTRFCPPNIL